MKTRRREIEGVSLSFLDVISCGFGALILLLVLTKVFEPVVIEETIDNLEAYLAALQQDLFDIRGETRELNREMIRREDTQETDQERLARLETELSALRSRYEATVDRSKVANVIEGQLAQAKQSLTEEMKRLLADYKRQQDEDKIGGVPVDSEYVIFIIDTSGSMQTAWPVVLRKVTEALEIYPQLKGIQVMNEDGKYMFSQYSRDWIPDTLARRKAIIDRLRTWQLVSSSNPAAGITKAVSTFFEPGKKISVYLFGDDFQGRSVSNVVRTVDRINRSNEKGERLVRIHAVLFPTIFDAAPNPQYHASIRRFANLMRTLCERNGGTFIALNTSQTF